jgi:hypothetical protein
MTHRIHNFFGVAVLFLLLTAAFFAPSVFFNILDSGREKQIIATHKETVTTQSDSDPTGIASLEYAMRLVDNSSSKNMLAIQKKQVTDSELKGLEFELSKLYRCGLVQGMPLTSLSDHLVYVAYYNIVNPTLEDPTVSTLSIKEYKFSDYANFEYSFWVGSESGKIYEATLIDDRVNFTLSDIDYMTGISKYYGIDTINPLEPIADSHIQQYQISIDDYQTTSYYDEFSIYNPSKGSFVANNSGINWSIFPMSLTEK